jgi:hypothetical protein
MSRTSKTFPSPSNTEPGRVWRIKHKGWGDKYIVYPPNDDGSEKVIFFWYYQAKEYVEKFMSPNDVILSE